MICSRYRNVQDTETRPCGWSRLRKSIWQAGGGGVGVKSGRRAMSGLLLFNSHNARGWLDFLLGMVTNIFRRDVSKNRGEQQGSLDFSSVGIQSITAI